MRANGSVKLQVYVKRGCESCERARTLARGVDTEFPPLSVEVIDVTTRESGREDVFAVPTFVLEDRVLSLGNPQQAELRSQIVSVLRARGLV